MADDGLNNSGSTGITRRDVLRRSGGVALATLWVTPVVQSVGGAAFAAGSPAPTPSVLPTKTGHTPDTGVEGTKLPRTGSSLPLTEVAVVGAGMVAGGVVLRKVTKRAATDKPQVEPP